MDELREDSADRVGMQERDLEQSLGGASGGTAQIEAEDGRYTISLARVVYVKRYSREGRVGFSGS